MPVAAPLAAGHDAETAHAGQRLAVHPRLFSAQSGRQVLWRELRADPRKLHDEAINSRAAVAVAGLPHCLLHKWRGFVLWDFPYHGWRDFPQTQ